MKAKILTAVISIISLNYVYASSPGATPYKATARNIFNDKQDKLRNPSGNVQYFKNDEELGEYLSLIDYTDPELQKATTTHQAETAIRTQMQKRLDAYLPLPALGHTLDTSLYLTEIDRNKLIDDSSIHTFLFIDEGKYWWRVAPASYRITFDNPADPDDKPVKPDLSRFKPAKSSKNNGQNNNDGSGSFLKWIAGIGITSGLAWLIYTQWFQENTQDETIKKT